MTCFLLSREAAFIGLVGEVNVLDASGSSRLLSDRFVPLGCCVIWLCGMFVLCVCVCVCVR